MKAEEMRGKTADQLTDEMLGLRKEQFNLRFQRAFMVSTMGRFGLGIAGVLLFATLLEELWTRGTGWIRGGAINFPDGRDIQAFFDGRRLEASISPLWGRTPFASHLVRIEPAARREG